jgi:hypothetical protein
LLTSKGAWFDSFDFAGGTFTLGALSYTGGVAQLFDALKEGAGDFRFIGLIIIDRAITAGEKAKILTYYSTRGVAGEYDWQPTDLDSKLVAWYDPSDLDTLFQDSAGTTPVTATTDPVGKVLDKSGNGHHATQSTDTARATLLIAGGINSLKFDGIDDFLVTSSIDLTATDEVSTFVSAEMSDSGRFLFEFSASVATNTGSFSSSIITTSMTSLSRGTAANNSNQRASQAATAGVDYVISSTHDISGDLTTQRINSVAGTNATGDKGAGNFGNYPLYIGARNGTTSFYDREIFTIFIMNDVATAQEIASAEVYMNKKTGRRQA